MYRQMSVTRQTGLTLLELVVSLLVMTILTSVAITSVSGIQEQARYEKTRERLEAIRKAILGDPGHTVNGQPMISGFVADMGRLPQNIHELLEKDFCSDRTYSDQTSCTANGGTWHTQNAWQMDSTSGLGYGWRGPYLVINDNPTADEAFTDGWGNVDSSTTSHDYGWVYNINSMALTLQSLGQDGTPGGTKEYDKDFPANQPFIARHDWIVDISAGIQINLNKYSTGGNKDICLRIFYRDPNSGTPTIISDSSDKVTVNDSTLPTGILFSPVDQHDIDNDGDSAEPLPYVPFGILAIGVYEFDSTVTPGCTTNPFPTGKSPQWVVFLPNTQPIINW